MYDNQGSEWVQLLVCFWLILVQDINSTFVTAAKKAHIQTEQKLLQKKIFISWTIVTKTEYGTVINII